MTDEEYLFRQTERERKRNGYGDKCKKRQGGRVVRLPSDNLTRKEMEAMNGEVKSYSLKAFYSWDEFKSLPDDIKLRWINSFITRYNIGIKTVADHVLHVDVHALRKHMEKCKLLQYVNRGGRGSASKHGLEQLLQDMRSTRSTDTENTVISVPNDEVIAPNDKVFVAPEIVEAHDEVVEKCDDVESVKKWDMNNIAVLLSTLIGTGAKLTIEVTL